MILLGLILGCEPAQKPKHKLKYFEASGVVRSGDELLLVHDDVAGAYFRLPVKKAKGVKTYKPKAAEIQHLAGAGDASDLEGIALGDGRVFVLSEELGAMVGEAGSRYQYSQAAQPIGNRGLEGLAIRPQEQGPDLVAALFEGGYLKKSQLPKKKRKELAGSFLAPFVITHELPKSGTQVSQSEDERAHSVELLLDELSGVVEPGQRFRAVDLVWHELATPNTSETVETVETVEWGWIVLLSSDAPPSEPTRHAHLWLQRFECSGHPVGAPFDVAAWLETQGKGASDKGDWEGLGWWKPGHRLVLVDDTGKEKSHLAFVEIPKAWRKSGD